MSKLIVTLETLKAVNLFSSKEETRYYLNGVFFDGEKGLLVATDGHRCFVAKPEGGFPIFESFIMPSHVIKSMKGGTKNRKAYVLIDTDTKQAGVYDYNGLAPSVVDFDVAFAAIDTLTKYTPIDGTFPPYTRIIPDIANYTSERAPSPQVYNPAYLGTLAGVVSSIEMFFHESATSPMVFRCKKEDHFEGFGLMIPMRGNCEVQQAIPSWIREEKIAAIEEAVKEVA